MDINLNHYLKKRKGPTSKRADTIQQLAELVGLPFEAILHQTFQLTEPEILAIYFQARGWTKNPRALALKLLKEKRQQIKQKLNKYGK
jgi:hypothetical protein